MTDQEAPDDLISQSAGQHRSLGAMAKPYEAIAAAPPVESGNEKATQEVTAIRESCEYISGVLGNFNSNLNQLPLEAQYCVKELNKKIEKLILRDSNSAAVGGAKPKLGMAAARISQNKIGMACLSGKLSDESEVCETRQKTKYEKTKKTDSSYSKLRRLKTVNPDHVTSYDGDSSDFAGSRTSIRKKYRKTKVRKARHKSRIAVDSESSGGELLSEPVQEGKYLKRRKERKRSHQTHNTYSDSSESSAEESSGERQPKYESGRRGYISGKMVVQALQQLDHRSVPKPEKFDLSAGCSFKHFLSAFEEYCSHTFRGSSSLWVSELGRFLSGEMLGAYEVLKVAGDDYRTIKKKLLGYVKDSRETYEINAKERFAQAKKGHEETYRLYGARLEKLFRVAYPHRRIGSSTTLKRKFLSSVPKGFRKQMRTAQSICKTMNKVELTWENILSLASRHDADHDASDTAPESERDKTWVNSCHSLPQQPNSWEISEVNLSRPTFRSLDPRNQALTGKSGKEQRSPTFYNRRATDDYADYNHPESVRRSEQAVKTCNHCQKIGHLVKDCRRRLGLCLVCGSSDHYIASCPNRRTLPLNGLGSQQQQPQQRVSIQDNAHPQYNNDYGSLNSHALQ